MKMDCQERELDLNFSAGSENVLLLAETSQEMHIMHVIRLDIASKNEHKAKKRRKQNHPTAWRSRSKVALHLQPILHIY
jgi:hypothetical protein